MSLGPNPPIMFWCRDKFATISDLKGKKVRIFNKTQADFVSALGAETITMPFPEVVPALQRGVVDCALYRFISPAIPPAGPRSPNRSSAVARLEDQRAGDQPRQLGTFAPGAGIPSSRSKPAKTRCGRSSSRGGGGRQLQLRQATLDPRQARKATIDLVNPRRRRSTRSWWRGSCWWGGGSAAA